MKRAKNVCLDSGWDPQNPSTDSAYRLYQDVLTRLTEYDEYSDNQLELYWSIGTALDVSYGVDGFFVWGKRICTLDLTRDPTKDKKADVLVVRSNFHGRYYSSIVEKIFRYLNHLD